MPVTLAQAKLLTQDDLDAQIIDEYRRSSALLDTLVWHDAVNPMGGGSTLTYGYHRVLAKRGAAFRAINSEYVPQEATKERKSTDLKPLGGSFQIDRVLAQIARGGEVTFQMQQLIEAASIEFADEFINGDVGVDANGFDGLDKALTGSTTEIQAGTPGNWTDLDTAGKSAQALDLWDSFLSFLDGPPTLVFGHQLALAKLRAIGRRANMYVQSPVAGLNDQFGNPIERQRFGNAVLVDPGDVPVGTGSRPIIPVYDPDSATYTVSVTGTPAGGTFSLLVSVNGGAPEETAAIAYNANAAAVDTAIENLSNVPASSVTVTGSGPYTVTFGGDLAGQDVTIALSDNNLTGGTNPSVTTVESGDAGGLTDIYAVRIGMNGVHGVTVAGQPLVRSWMPDFARAGAVKTGEVEMGPVSVVLKTTKSASVLRGVRIR